jgi:PII-like signaling protein
VRLERAALRLTIFIGEDDQWHHKPLFLPQLDGLIAEGLVIVEPVEVIRYVGRTPPESP